METLKAGKVRAVSSEAMCAIDSMFNCHSCFNYQPVGDSWEENGVVVLRPTDILEHDEDNDERKLETIARLVGEEVSALSKLSLLEVWDDR